MANLTPKTPFDGLLPIEVGSVALSEISYDSITWIAPAKGKQAAVSRTLEKRIGAAFPEPNRMTGNAARAVWTGPDQAMILGAEMKPITGAALSDQSSAWACCALDGADAESVMARLLPIDVRLSVFEVGHAARTILGHMNCVVMRVEAQMFEVMVFRSMAATLVHDVERALRMVAARAAIADA